MKSSIQAITWSLFGYKEPKRTTKLLIGLCLLIQTENISFQSSDMHRMQNFELVCKFFKGIFGLTLHGFLPFSGLPDWIMLILEWFERSLHAAQVRQESCLWALRQMTSQVVEGVWIHLGGSGANGLIHSFSLLFAELKCKFSLFLIHQSFFAKREVRCWNFQYSPC